MCKTVKLVSNQNGVSCHALTKKEENELTYNKWVNKGGGLMHA